MRYSAFIVQALKRYLKEAEKRIEKIGDEEEWARVLRDLCEKPKIIGFDINPFARLMAQIRFMMEIIPYYIKAQKASPDFVLTSIPIFRTDSLEIETKTGRFQKQLGEFAGDIKFFMRLPVISKEKEEFIPISFNIPAWEKVKDKLGKKEFYYLMLKQTFKVIKDSERRGKYELDKEELKRAFLILFAEEEAEEMASLMLDYANIILGQIYILRKEYSDGRLVKTLEDLVLAGILKNYFKYDYVVGNPPYVRTHHLPERERKIYRELYTSAFKQYDIYVLFIERGIAWLQKNGKFGYIVSSKFTTSDYGFKLREYILNTCRIDQIIDVSNFSVFKDAAIYPFIIILTKEHDENKRKNNQITVAYKLSEEEFNKSGFKSYIIPQIRFYNDNYLLFDIHSQEESKIIEKIEKSSIMIKEECLITRGFRPPPDNLIFSKEKAQKMKRNLRKFIRGDELIAPFRVRWKGYYIHYDKDKIFESKPEHIFEQPKIMIRDIGLHASAYYDEEGFYCLKTIYLILKKPNSSIDLKFLTGVLNSKLIEFYFKTKFWAAHIGSGYLRFRKQYLERLPIKLPKIKEISPSKSFSIFIFTSL